VQSFPYCRHHRRGYGTQGRSCHRCSVNCIDFLAWTHGAGEEINGTKHQFPFQNNQCYTINLE